MKKKIKKTKIEVNIKEKDMESLRKKTLRSHSDKTRSIIGNHKGVILVEIPKVSVHSPIW